VELFFLFYIPFHSIKNPFKLEKKTLSLKNKSSQETAIKILHNFIRNSSRNFMNPKELKKKEKKKKRRIFYGDNWPTFCHTFHFKATHPPLIMTSFSIPNTTPLTTIPPPHLFSLIFTLLPFLSGF